MSAETNTVEKLIYAIATVAGDDEATDRVAAAGTTQRKINRNEPVTGAPRLAELLGQWGQKVVRAVAEWFGGAPAGAEPEPLTDTGNAKRLVNRHGETLKFSHTTQDWLVWVRNRWENDGTEEIVRRAKETAASIRQEASLEKDDAKRNKLLAWAKTSEGAARIRAMSQLAQSDPAVSIQIQDLDKDLMLLNCNNGTLDLRTGALRPHDRSDLISKVAPVDYVPAAPCPRWRAFLEVITLGRPDLMSFLQRAIGYGLTGSTQEQVLFFLVGSGANGKSTLLETVRAMVGDYSAQSDFSTLLCGPEGRARNDLARLVGKRFVTAVEVGRGQALSEVVVKQITGGDTIAARFLYCESFEFVPQFKLFLAANHGPTAPGVDDAIWRRILVVPFDVQISPERRDKRLLERLREELPGILAWAVEGCLMWQREGLNPPREVLAASGTCREEHDSIGAFLATDCLLDPQQSTSASDLYVSYQQFCSDMGLFCESQRSLGLALGKLGLRRIRPTGRYTWVGIGLR